MRELRSWRTRHAEDGLSLRRLYLPAEPLLSMLDDVVLEPGSRIAKAKWRAQHSGTFTVGMVDEICVSVLRRHPCDVYGEAWWA